MPDSPTTNINPEYTKEGFGDTSDQTHIVSMPDGVQGMLDQTLGEVIQNNPQAQQLIIQSMGITPEKFEEMRSMAQGSDMMHMKIRDLINNGVVQQAVSESGNVTQAVAQNTNTSFLDKVRGWFK